MSTGRPDVAPRSLADDLRGRDDAELAALLAARPDLLHPVPADLTALAVRSAGPSAVGALDRLDRFTLQVAEVVAALPAPVSQSDVLSAVAGPDAPEAHAPDPAAADPVAVRAAAAQALQRLRTLALLWGPPGDLRLVRSAVDALGPHPCGLGPSERDTRPLVRAYADDPGRLAAELDAAPAAAVAALDALLWGPPIGTVADAERPVSRETARTPVEWLLARDLLVPLGPDAVAIPREVAVAVRGGRLVRHPAVPLRAPVPAARRDPDLVDRTAGGHAAAVVDAVARLLDTWSTQPPPVLRSGGLGVRELAAAARLLDTDEATAALVAELALAADLLAGDLEADESWLPTPAYDLWAQREPAGRWAVLARGWLDAPRAAGLVGGRDARGGRVNALGPDVERPGAGHVRQSVLQVLADLPPGAAADADDVIGVLADREPRRASAARDDLVRWTLQEAATLGVTGLGAIAGPGRLLLDGARERRTGARGDRAAPAPALVAAMAPLLPAPVDHVLLQADLTAVAPGPLTADLDRELRLVADVESTGGATVFRFSDASVRRALDAGRDAAGLLAMLAAHSRTPVPQPLEYLVADVARRHGAVRVGAAAAYVRCDDETTLTALLADRAVAGLGLHRLAPTVVAAQAGPDEVLAALRAAGLAPVAEAADGTVVVQRPATRRAAHRTARHRRDADAWREPEPALVAAAVRALRAGDRAATGTAGATARGGDRAALPRTSTARTVELVRSALDDGRPLLIGYADTAGSTTQRLVEPVRLTGGFLTAYDHRADEVRTFALARITGVADVAD